MLNVQTSFKTECFHKLKQKHRNQKTAATFSPKIKI